MNQRDTTPSRSRTILAGLVGNVMEWYDFAVYGYFAVVIGKLFFPSDDPSISLIAAFGAFAAGFLVRPLGGLIFGRIGDLVGHKRALTLSMMAMAVPTVLMGLLPTYEAIGVLAPVLIVALRIVQGLSVGGEYTIAVVYLTTNAPPGRRSFTGVWGYWGAIAGMLLGSSIGAVMTYLLDDAQIQDWGWRLPFLAGGVVAAAGFLIRRAMHAEAPSGQSSQPIRDTFGKYRMSILRVALLNVGFAVAFYTAFIYSVTYIKTVDELGAQIAFTINTEAMALLLVILPLAALLSDRVGRRPLLIAGYSIITFAAIPLFHLMHTTDPAVIFAGEAGFILGVGLICGGLVANVELMPRPVRCTGFAFAYNIAFAVFGGTTPLIATWLISASGDPIAPAYWVAAGGAVSLLTAIFLVRETAFEPME